MTHEEASALLAAFALDAVGDVEREQIEAHQAECPRCRAELDAHREVAAALGNSVEPLPEGLWSSIAGRLPARHDEEPPPMPVLVRPGPEAVGPSSRRFQRAEATHAARSPRGRLVAAGSFAVAAAAVAVVLGLNLAHDNGQITRLQHAIGTGAPSAVEAALHTPGHAVVNVESPGHDRLAQFVIVPAGQGYLVQSHLPTLSNGDTYQLWGVTGGKAISLGLLGRSPHQVTFTLAGPRRGTTLAITAEPAGGSVAPSSPIVASGPI
jgi:anti-sigma-K factor RskA